MTGTKEWELWNTREQECLGRYRNQSSVLTALYDFERLGTELDHLDILFCRPHSDPIHVCSGRDDVVKEWLDSLYDLSFDLRLAGTDVMGLDEYLQYSGYEIDIKEYPPQQPYVLSLGRYHCLVTKNGIIGEADGATMTEAQARAYLQREGQI